MKAVLVAAALLAGVTAPAFAGGGGGEPGIGCEVKWAALSEPTSEPVPVTLYAPAGMECY